MSVSTPAVSYRDYRGRVVQRYIARRIVRARVDCGWNISELAHLMDVEPGCVARWESESGDLPGLCELLALSRVTGHPVEWFFPVDRGEGWALDWHESTLLFLYRRLSVDDREYLRSVAAVLLGAEGVSYEGSS